MSKEVYFSRGEHELQLTQYFGGSHKGLCLQITGRNCDNNTGYVGMTKEEAAEIGEQLLLWSNAADDFIKDAYQKGTLDEQERAKDIIGAYYAKALQAVDKATENGSSGSFETATIIKDLLLRIYKQITQGEENGKDGENGSCDE